MWEFIMQAGYSYNLYGNGNMRALADRITGGIVLIYSIDTDLLIY